MRQFLLNTRSLIQYNLSQFILAPVRLLFDTFTDTNGTNLNAHTPEQGGPWSYAVGQVWEIQTNEAHYISGSTGPLQHSAIALVDAGQADVTIKSPMTTGPNNTVSPDSIAAGLAYRHTDDNNRYWVDGIAIAWTGLNSWRMVKLQGGVGTLLSESTGQSIAVNTEYDLELVLAGDTMELRVDGVLKASSSDAFNNTVTTHGLHLTTADTAGTPDTGSFWSSMEIK